MGVEAVGKTSLIRRYVDNKFSESYIPTLLTDFTTRQINYKGKIIRLLLYELGGHEQFRIDQRRHFQKADYLCIVVSIHPDESQSIKKLPNLIRTGLKNWKDLNGKGRLPLLIVMNKIDLIRDNDKSSFLYRYKKRLMQLTVDFSINGIVFTSAKTGEGVEILFYKIATELLRHRN